MRHVPESLILFLIHGMVVGIGLPLVKAIPAPHVDVWLGWVVLPFCLAPSIAVFFLRIDRIDRLFPYLVGGSVCAVCVALLVKLGAWVLMSAVGGLG